jgi:hypothetical protein
MNNYKYYLTFDVGIKNLAYCLSRYDTTKMITDGLDIIDWGILDVSYKPLICKQIKNKRKICNANSIYYCLKADIPNIPSSHKNSNNLIGYCQEHSNELKIKDKKLHSQLFRISKNLIFVNNFNVQMERLLKALEIFYNTKLSSLYDTQNSELEARTNSEYLISNLDIYIENQPVFKNPIMKTISIGIFTFFTLKKIISTNIIKSVNFISASDKTHLSFITSMKEILKINPKPNINYKNYAERKAFAIDMTNQIVKNLNKSIFNIVSSVNYDLSVKKDDMADTLIYVVVILLKQKNN